MAKTNPSESEVASALAHTGGDKKEAARLLAGVMAGPQFGLPKYDDPEFGKRPNEDDWPLDLVRDYSPDIRWAALLLADYDMGEAGRTLKILKHNAQEHLSNSLANASMDNVTAAYPDSARDAYDIYRREILSYMASEGYDSYLRAQIHYFIHEVYHDDSSDSDVGPDGDWSM